jgi:hypothetical protein
VAGGAKRMQKCKDAGTVDEKRYKVDGLYRRESMIEKMQSHHVDQMLICHSLHL